MAALTFDMLQYVFGYFVATRAYSDAEQRRQCGQSISEINVDYDDKHWTFQLQLLFFWSKLAALAVAVVLLMIAAARIQVK